MNTTIETIPTVWDDERDGQFFRLTAALFEPAFCYGTGLLLASYDPDDSFAEPISVVASYDPSPPPVIFAATSTKPASPAA